MNHAMTGANLAFVAGVVQSTDVFRVVGQLWAEDGGFLETWLLKWTASTRQWLRFPVPRLMNQIDVSMTSSPFAIAGGPDGSVAVLAPGGNTFEVISGNGRPAIQIGQIRRLRVIGSTVVACGMGRQVFQRASGGWLRIDQGVVVRADDLVVSGFNSIDGVRESNILAVGYNGEIWMRSDGVWAQVDSPTNIVLNDVICISDDRAYCCGKGGILLSREGSNWKVVEHNATKDEFWSLTWFKDELYVASTKGVYRLVGGTELRPVSIEGCKSFAFLDASAECILSIGLSSVFYSIDGVSWQDVTPQK